MHRHIFFFTHICFFKYLYCVNLTLCNTDHSVACYLYTFIECMIKKCFSSEPCFCLVLRCYRGQKEVCWRGQWWGGWRWWGGGGWHRGERRERGSGSERQQLWHLRRGKRHSSDRVLRTVVCLIFIFKRLLKLSANMKRLKDFHTRFNKFILFS